MLVFGEPTLKTRQLLFGIESGPHADARRQNVAARQIGNGHVIATVVITDRTVMTGYFVAI